MSMLTRWEPTTRWNPFKELQEIENRLANYFGRPNVRRREGGGGHDRRRMVAAR